MSRRIRHILLAVFLTAASLHAGQLTLRGRVVGVQDGDSLTLLDATKTQHRIRLAGIDASERPQPYNAASKKYLSDLVFNRIVDVLVTKTDRYGRLVGKVVIDGCDASLEQLREGIAWYYFDFERELSPQDRALYLNAHRDARAARRGLWADPSATPPWQFRRSARQNRN